MKYAYILILLIGLLLAIGGLFAYLSFNLAFVSDAPQQHTDLPLIISSVGIATSIFAVYKVSKIYRHGDHQ